MTLTKYRKWRAKIINWLIFEIKYNRFLDYKEALKLEKNILKQYKIKLTSREEERINKALDKIKREEEIIKEPPRDELTKYNGEVESLKNKERSLNNSIKERSEKIKKLTEENKAPKYIEQLEEKIKRDKRELEEVKIQRATLKEPETIKNIIKDPRGKEKKEDRENLIKPYLAFKGIQSEDNIKIIGIY